MDLLELYVYLQYRYNIDVNIKLLQGSYSVTTVTKPYYLPTAHYL